MGKDYLHIVRSLYSEHGDRFFILAGSQQIYEVDEVAESGSTWTYTFLDCTTRNPVFVTFSSGGYSRSRHS